MPKLTLALAQISSVVGDVEANVARLQAARKEAAAFGADLVLTPELSLTGYPPEDLVLKPAFQDLCRHACEALAKDGGPALLLGLPWVQEGKLYNAVALLAEGRIADIRFKTDLPNYGVFDEKRVFCAAPLPEPILFRGVRIGLAICEDLWSPQVAAHLARQGADILLVPNASPYERGKLARRQNVACARVAETGLPLIYLNIIGGQDEIVFDGASFALHKDATLAAQMPAFQEGMMRCVWEPKLLSCEEALAPLMSDDESDYAACVLGLRDYVERNRFSHILLGLSGGIDSALCAAMAADALGPERVHALVMPSRFTSQASLDDAQACAQALGVRYEIVPINIVVEATEQALAPLLGAAPHDITAENIQSRVRGLLLMAAANTFGGMVISTGNKSEMAVGYATLYGDMNGGFNPIKDIYKTQVFRLAALRNRWRPPDAKGASGIVIPEGILTKPPSAELRDNQRDEDTLPPYSILDALLQALVEEDKSVAEIIALGYEAGLVRRVEGLLYAAEYKRRQAPPGVKVSAKSFGRERRYPIVNGFRDRP